MMRDGQMADVSHFGVPCVWMWSQGRALQLWSPWQCCRVLCPSSAAVILPGRCREQHPALEGDVSSQAAHDPHAHSVRRGVHVQFWDGCTAKESLWPVSQGRDGWYFPISNLSCASTGVLTPRQCHPNSPRASVFTLSVTNLEVLISQAWEATRKKMMTAF